MKMKRILLLVAALVLITTNAFAYPSLNDNCAYIGKCDWYWVEIDTSQEYYWDDPHSYPAIEVVVISSFTEEGRKNFFKNTKGSYKDEAQWLVQHVRYEFYPNYGTSKVLDFQILDADRNVMLERTNLSKVDSWGDNWVANNIVGFIHDQFRNGAYTDQDGKVCYN